MTKIYFYVGVNKRTIHHIVTEVFIQWIGEYIIILNFTYIQ